MPWVQLVKFYQYGTQEIFNVAIQLANKRSLTDHLQSENSDFHLWATNVYVPIVDAEHDEFFDKIRHIPRSNLEMNKLQNSDWQLDEWQSSQRYGPISLQNE
jgi:hypothetical protein